MNALLLLAPLVLLLADAEVAVLTDQSFSLHASAEEASESVGLYAIRATELDGQIKITESAQLVIDQSVIEFTSVVVYKQDDQQAWRFDAATATTRVDDDEVMKVSVEPRDKQWAVAQTLLREPFGEAYDKPKESRLAIDVPKGPVLFSSARAIIGPRLQPEAGEQPIVWVEFPDDIDEAINVKEGFTLVRDKPDAEGAFMLWIRSEHQTLGPLPLTADGKVKPHKLWGKILMREK
eukprot:g15151.t1